MMDTLLFKIGSTIFLGGSTIAAFVFPGLNMDGKNCDRPCPTKAAMVSTVEQTAEPAAMEARCAKKAAAMAKKNCDKQQKVAAKAGCPYSAKKAAMAAKSDCRKSAAGTQVAQNTEGAQQPSVEN